MRIRVFLVVSLAAQLAGCATSGVFPAATVTQVALQEDNYALVATNVEGEATAAYIFGVSASLFTEMRTVALFRIEGTGYLYAEALEDFWRNFEAAHGTAEGRSLALVNVRYDSDALNLIVYTRPRVVIRADVIEFED